MIGRLFGKLNGPGVWCEKSAAKIKAKIGMWVGWIGDEKVPPEQYQIRDISFDNYRGRHLLHFTDHTHTSHPEKMRVLYDVVDPLAKGFEDEIQISV